MRSVWLVIACQACAAGQSEPADPSRLLENGNHQEVAEAIAASASWLELLDAERYEDAWRQGGIALRKVNTIGQWMLQRQGLRESLGKMRSRFVEEREYTASGRDGTAQAFVVYRCAFEKKIGVHERLSLAKEEGKTWRVVGYWVDLPGS